MTFTALFFISSYLALQLTETLGKQMNDIIPELALKRKQSFLSTSNAAIRRSTISYIRKMSVCKALLDDEFFKIEK